MRYWGQYPLYRVLFPFIIGIGLNIVFDFKFRISIYAIFSSIAILIFIAFYSYKYFSYKLRWINGFAISIIAIIFGLFLSFRNNEFYNDTHFSHHLTKNSIILAHISDEPEEKPKSIKIKVDIKNILNNNENTPVTGSALIYFVKDTASLHLRYGSTILIKNAFRIVDEPANPYEMNYKKHLAMRNIYHRAYLKHGEWINLNDNHGKFIKSIALKIRRYFLDLFKQNGLKGEEYAVASAIILGYTQYLEPELMKEYSSAGIIHILSVSGLHVGIVYVVINFLLKFLERYRKGKLIKAALIIIIVWFYAVITGLSPAVTRAALMFSLIIIGKTFNRHTDTLNAIAGSALLLLIYNPFFIADIGFQLSYLSVTGIVLLNPHIKSLYAPKNKLAILLWEMIAVSISAQIIASPICMYYFHQFPSMFLVTNLIAIPLSTLILYSGMLVLVFSPITMLSAFLGKITSWLIYAMNVSIRTIDTFPMTVIRNIRISLPETILLYAFLLLLFYSLFLKKKNLLPYAFVCFLMLGIYSLIINIEKQFQSSVIVYNIRKSSAIDIVKERKTYFIADTTVLKNEKNINFSISNNWTHNGIKKIIHIPKQNSLPYFINNEFFATQNFCYVSDKTIALINKKCFERLDKKVEIDLAIVTNNCKADAQKVIEYLQPKFLVIDASNGKYYKEKWKQECIKFNIPYHIVSEMGAFVKEL